MTHHVHMPLPENDLVRAMGSHLFKEAVAEHVDLGDMRSVHACLQEPCPAKWTRTEIAHWDEEAVEYARSLVQRRAKVRDYLTGTSEAVAFAAVAAIGALLLRPDPAWAAHRADLSADLAGLCFGLILPLAFVVVTALAVLRRGGRLVTEPDEAFGDTTLFGERER